MNFSRVFKRKRTYLFLFIIGFLVFFYSFGDLRKSDTSFVESVSDNVFDYSAKIVHYDTLGRHIRYIEVGDDDKPLLVLLHGAPSSSSFWEGYLKDSTLLANFKVIAPDRPGYGYSDYGKVETSIKKQAQALSKILKDNRSKYDQIIVQGSSYGGSITASLAMQYPDLLDGIILQSSSTKPTAEKTYNITHYTSGKPLSYLVPGALQMANLEKLSHKAALREIENEWSNIKVPMLITHGDKDGLVYPENATFSYDMASNSPLKEIWWAKDAGHTLAFTHRKLMLEAMLEMKKWVSSAK